MVGGTTRAAFSHTEIHIYTSTCCSFPGVSARLHEHAIGHFRQPSPRLRPLTSVVADRREDSISSYNPGSLFAHA